MRKKNIEVLGSWFVVLAAMGLLHQEFFFFFCGS
jgi:hypothetical protein